MAPCLRLLFAVSTIAFLFGAEAAPRPASAHYPRLPASAPPHWQPQGPTGGYLLGVTTSPDFAADHTVYTTGPGGVFISHDGAASWQPANKGLGNQIIRFVVVAGRGTAGSPIPRTLIVNSVDGVVATSIDGGAFWKTSGQGLAGQNISALAPSPGFSQDGTVFAGTSEGALYRSTDGTTSWARVHAPLAGKPMVMDVAISPSYAHDHTVVIATASGLVASRDGGTSWHGLLTPTSTTGTAGAQPASYDAVLFSPNYASDHTVYAGGDTLVVSHDGGVHWQTLGEVASGLAVRGLFISPTFALDGIMVAVASAADARGVGSALLSRDRGKSWKPFGGLIGANDVYALAFSPSYAADHLLYAAGAGVGLLTSADRGQTWSIANRGLYDQIINSIAVSPAFAADHTIYASAVGSGLYISPSGGGTWSPAGQNINSRYAVNSVALSPQFSRDHSVFLGAINAYLQSADGGKTWDLSYASLPDQDVHKIVVSPTYARDHTVVALGSKIGIGAYVPTVFASADRGLTWSESDSGIDGELAKAAAFSPDYSLDHTLFVGTGSVSTNGTKGGVYVTHDSGGTWSLAGHSFSGVDVLSLALSPRYPTDPTLFAGTSKGLYISHDAGATWQGAQKLRDQEIAALILSPIYSTDGVVFAGGASGLYKSTDRGQTWASIGAALPSPRVTALAASVNYAVDHLLFVGTPNSLWSTAIAPSGPATPLPTSVIGLGF